MVVIGIFALVIGVIALIAGIGNKFDAGYFAWGPLIIGVVLLSIVAVSTWIFFAKVPKGMIESVEWKTSIVALKDNSNVQGKISGSLFITSGYVSEGLNYYCMESTNKGKHMISIPAGSTYIVESNTEKPSVTKYKYAHTFWYNFFALEGEEYEKYTIIVPNGTVDTSYKIDME